MRHQPVHADTGSPSHPAATATAREELPDVALPPPSPGRRDSRVAGTAGPGRHIPAALVPPSPVHPRTPR